MWLYEEGKRKESRKRCVGGDELEKLAPGGRQIIKKRLWTVPSTSQTQHISGCYSMLWTKNHPLMKQYRYLGRFFYVSYVCLDPERPLYMNVVLIKLQQKYYKDKQSVHHEEGENRFVSQFDQIRCYPSL